ncbi:MAG: single-stranded DNA-binding protein [Thermoanaerobaculia bacterium]|nr:single-stranded DNA-binding protein [Thermoanaerobaculia bacterium]MCZ7650768.1 single-stranded DNA-binding protein [Thermoanaerobaculia bacterium]
MVNKVILVGNLGRDPEQRSLPSGQAVTSFSLATSRRFKMQSGEQREETEWHNVVCYGKQAEIAARYLVKGKMVFVEGRIQTRSWEDRNTKEKRYRTEIICENFQMLGGRPGEGRGGATSDPAAGGYDEHGPGDSGPEDDDIPF